MNTAELVKRLAVAIAHTLDDDLREMQGHGEDEQLCFIQLLRNTTPGAVVTKAPVTVQRCLACGFAAGFCRCSNPEPE